ncbi:hypothetical protein [Ammoniphilus sp. YIM 78166]|uniref:hypothetical protein n=1 Tax=Ammoniphilus sp. YIM 78166 TaxID=1644106 RepID=UPI00106F8C60|nr:hypothetical protein [Ammoniphilus sp. YIM 78166]
MRILLTFLFFTLLIGCSSSSTSEGSYAVKPYPPVVTSENKAYVESGETVSAENIGKQIGEVKSYVDPNETMPEEDDGSTFAPVGSKLYEIKGMKLKDGFAVEINGEYRKLTHSEP